MSAPAASGSAFSDRVVVVLVEPLYPGNVGASARAMKNFGLSRLVVVAPPAFDAERARWMAPGAHDVLANARFVATVDEALEGVHRAVATTARHRKHRQRILTPATLGTEIAEDDGVTAVLFGREDHGLDADSVGRCEALIRIPTAEHASLNLGQAVLLTCNALFEAARARGLRADGRPIGGHGVKTTRDFDREVDNEPRATLDRIRPTVDAWMGMLDRVGYLKGGAPEKVRTTLQGLFQRGTPSRREMDAFRGMVNRIEWALDHPDIDPKAPRKGKSG